MPVFIIEGPAGLQDGAKKILMAEVTAALDEAYHIPDVRIFLREHTAANVAQDGFAGAEPIRPVCFVEAPTLPNPGTRRTLIAKLNSVIANAYTGIANTDDILILCNDYSLEMAGAGGRLQSENPEIAATLDAAE